MPKGITNVLFGIFYSIVINKLPTQLDKQTLPISLHLWPLLVLKFYSSPYHRGKMQLFHFCKITRLKITTILYQLREKKVNNSTAPLIIKRCGKSFSSIQTTCWKKPPCYFMLCFSRQNISNKLWTFKTQCINWLCTVHANGLIKNLSPLKSMWFGKAQRVSNKIVQVLLKSWRAVAHHDTTPADKMPLGICIILYRCLTKKPWKYIPSG